MTTIQDRIIKPKSQTEGKKEKLIITCEVEDFPEDGSLGQDYWFYSYDNEVCNMLDDFLKEQND